MAELYRQMAMVATTDAAVLIEGETGTGKNLVARALHDASGRAEEPFVALNASNLQEQLFESELFGHVRGAFSGAHQDYQGLARAAGGGTLFIDEVAELSLPNQARFLQFLDDKKVRAIGATRRHRVDVRIIAATNRDLRAAVEKGKFREDLLYRLRVVVLRVPPLRRRDGDVSLLIDHFLAKYAREHGREVPEMSDAVTEALLGHGWPGNVRELQNTIERAVVMSPQGERIDLGDLNREVRGASRDDSIGGDDGTDLREHRREAERRLIEETLRRHDGNVSAASRDLGFSRVGLSKKMKRLGIERPR
jgi:transcriptional regulator with PAS, ATPase and Fis domain